MTKQSFFYFKKARIGITGYSLNMQINPTGIGQQSLIPSIFQINGGELWLHVPYTNLHDQYFTCK